MSRAVLIQCKVSDFQIGSHSGGIKSRRIFMGQRRRQRATNVNFLFCSSFVCTPKFTNC